MASTTLLSARMAPAASLEVSQLDQLASGNLDAFLDEAVRLAAAPKQSGSTPRRQQAGKPPRTHAAKKAAARSPHKRDEPAIDGPAPPPANISPERLAKLRAANDIVTNSWQFKATRSVRAAAVLASLHARRVPAGGPAGLAATAAALISSHDLDDTTYLYDLGNTTRLLAAWRAALPRVAPFYAVKCNPEPALLRLLAALGAGFDCASRAELEAVLALGVPTSRIIFAHPCKRPADLRYARDVGVNLTTFDTESELSKVAATCPGIQLVLRVRCDDPEARVPLGLKYGADPEEGPSLLATAARLGLAVVGVSFHVGSACKNLGAYAGAIATARRLFDAGAAAGHTMSLLDIGGGFTGHFDGHGHVMFGGLAAAINGALAAHFPAGCGVRVIAEPGRYFAESSAALLVPIYGVRDRKEAGGGVHKDYWLTDGLYGSFNCILYDDQRPQPRVLRSPLLPALQGCEAGGEAGGGAAAGAAGEAQFSSTLWGPTCDSADFLYKDVALPVLRVGDWLMFTGAGAYTVAGACDFNGIAMTAPAKFYLFSACAVDEAADEADEQESGEQSEQESEEGEEAAAAAAT